MVYREKAISFALILILSYAVLAQCNQTSAQLLGLPPQPYITSPSNDEFLYSLPPMVKATGNPVQIRAVDLSGEDDVTLAIFEFSSNLIEWELIAIDENPGFEGVQFNGDGGTNSTNGWGDTGWGCLWDTTGLEDGQYMLRVTLMDGEGLFGITEIIIHYDPTPPSFDVSYPESFGMDVIGPLSGVVTMGASTEDEDAIAFILEYLNASRPYANQEGLGDADQRDVGKSDDKGTFENTDDVNNFCGPAAAANALWRLAQRDPALNSDGKGGNFSSAAEMGKELAKDTNTSVTNGTATDDMTDGLRKYLKDRGLDGNYSVKAHIPNNQGGGRPWWSDVANALREGEAVIVLKVKPGSDGVVGTADDRGHYETGKDAYPTYSSRGGGKISVTDPMGPADKNGTVKAVPRNNGFEGVWFDEDGDGKIGPCEVWYLFAWWEVSPKNSYTWGLQRTQFVTAGTDSNASDGLSVPFNTTGLHDGFYLLKMTIVDATGNFAMNRTTAYIDNGPPAPVTIGDPYNVSTSSASVSWSESQDEDFYSYTVYISSSSGSLGEARFNHTDWRDTDAVLSGLQPGAEVYVTVATEDHAGGVSHSQQRAVRTSSPPPLVDPTTASAAVMIVAAAAIVGAAYFLRRRH